MPKLYAPQKREKENEKCNPLSGGDNFNGRQPSKQFRKSSDNKNKGSTLIHATGETVPEENRELFVLKKANGSWKIDRYMFNKMK